MMIDGQDIDAVDVNGVRLHLTAPSRRQVSGVLDALDALDELAAGAPSARAQWDAHHAIAVAAIRACLPRISASAAADVAMVSGGVDGALVAQCLRLCGVAPPMRTPAQTRRRETALMVARASGQSLADAENMPAVDFRDWIDHLNAHPLGDAHLHGLVAQLCAMFYNANRGKNAAAMRATQFAPWLAPAAAPPPRDDDRPTVPVQTVEMMIRSGAVDVPGETDNGGSHD